MKPSNSLETIIFAAIILFSNLFCVSCTKTKKTTYPTTKYIGLIGRARNWHHSYYNSGVLQNYGDMSFSIKVINDITILGAEGEDTLVYHFFDTASNCLYFEIKGFHYQHSNDLIYFINNDSMYTQASSWGSVGGYGSNNIYNTY